METIAAESAEADTKAKKSKGLTQSIIFGFIFRKLIFFIFVSLSGKQRQGQLFEITQKRILQSRWHCQGISLSGFLSKNFIQKLIQL
jgi:hypothetical protein